MRGKKGKWRFMNEHFSLRLGSRRHEAACGENLPSVIHSLSLHSKVKLWSRMHWCSRVRSLHLELECIQNCGTTFKQQALSVWCSNCNHSFPANTANSLHAPQYTFSHSGTVTWRTSSSSFVSFWHWENDFAIHICCLSSWMEPDEWSW